MFRRITVERPLRLRYEVSEEAIDRLRSSKAFEGLVKPPANAKGPAKAIERREAAQRAIVDGLRALNGFTTTDRSEAEIKVRDVLRAVEKPTPALRKAAWEALSVRDPEAPVVTNSKGEPQPDPELRDYQNVSLSESIEDYRQREVFPFAEDAWVDESEERIGTAIPLTRLFYRFGPLRPLEDIDAEIRELERRIDALVMEIDERRMAVRPAAVPGEHLDRELEREEAGLPWLPTIPKHWRTAKLSLVARLGTGHTPSRAEPSYWEGERLIPWLTTSDVVRFRDDRCEVLTDTKESISQLGLERSAAVLHPAGTVALSRTASVGFSVIMGRAMATSQDFVTWTCSPLLEPRFLLLCLRAMRHDLVGRLAIGSTHKTIYMPDIQGLRIPLPPSEEQRRIVQHASEELEKLDRLSDIEHVRLSLLSERREALIGEAVGGRLERWAEAAISA